MNKYSLYKDIGLEWMGEIPNHWVITKNRYGFRKYKNRKNVSNETKVLSLTTKGVKIKRNLNFGKSTESYIGHQLVEVGDVVFTPRDFDQTPILSDVSKYDGCISNLYIVDKTKQGVLNHFVNYYWYGLKYSVDYFKIFSHGMRYSFNRFQFDEIPLLIPPLEEQQQIVSFLDDKNQKIDSLIEKIHRKVELLKTSIPNYYFYKKDEINFDEIKKYWFQKKPTSWKVIRMRELFDVISERNHPNERLLSVHQIKGVIYRDEQEQDVMSPSGDISNYKLVKPGDFIISLRSSEGGFEYSEVTGLVSPVYTVLRPKFEIDTIFYKYLFKTYNFIVELNRYIKGIRDGKNINFIDVRDVPVPVPTIYNSDVSNTHSDILKSFTFYKKRIELLKEYRQSLISEVVTGKIRVCEEDNSLSLNSQTV